MPSIFRSVYAYFIIVLSLLLTIIWFHAGLIEGGGEEGLAFYNPLKTYFLSATMWWDYDGGFPTLAWLPNENIFSFLALLYKKIHIANYLLQAGTFFILLVTGGISVFLLTKTVLQHKKRELIAVISAVFYLLNPFSMSQIWARGLEAQFFSFALLPLSLLLFLKGFKEKNILYVVVLSLVTALFSSAYGITTFVIAYWAVLTVVFFYLFFTSKKKTLRDKVFYLIYFLLAFVLWGMVNSNWLLPTVMAGNKIYAGSLQNAEENIGTLLGVSRNYPPLVSIRLLQNTYFFDPSAFSTVYSSLFFQAISFLLPIFLCIGLFTIFRKKEFQQYKIFVLLFLVGLIVSLGANPPFGWLFVWIFQHVPFLQGFRNPYEKFGIVYALGYAPLFALGLVYFFQQRFKAQRKSMLGIIIVLFLVCGVYVWPMWSGRVIAGPDKYPGIQIPAYYQQANSWLSQQGAKRYRVAMTPLWPGDGAFYQWGSFQYVGLDPMMYIFDTPSVSSNPSNFPYFSDFMRSIREKIYEMDVSGGLSLLRIKYLVDREDAVNISSTEKLHKTFLTDVIYPPNTTENLSHVICQDKIASRSGNTNPAWITCELESKEQDWKAVKYLHVVLKVDRSANLDLAVRDAKQNRPRWYGRDDQKYVIPANTWTTLILPLGVPTEVNYATDFEKIELVEIQAHPLNLPNESVDKIELQGIWLDEGKEEKVNNYKFVKVFDKLSVYEAKDVILSPEVGLLQSVEIVDTLDELLVQSLQKRESLETHGFIVSMQNKGKNLTDLENKATLALAAAKIISDTKYWLQVKNKEKGFIVLSKTFNTQWKVIPGVEERELHGGFFDNISLLKKSFVAEDNHYVVNGYANLWKVDTNTDTFAVVFIPQLYADIGRDISKISVLLISLFIVDYFVRKKIKN